MRIEALQEYQKRLAEPVELNNDVLINFASCMLAELTMRPYKTALTLHSKTFTAAEFIEWAMGQPEVRDQCDALFIGNELLTRGVFLPVSYGEWVKRERKWVKRECEWVNRECEWVSE